ncbi:membrane protein [Caballeronia hypogeia]|uniref:Membrane protein n=1 Tax=Caballeronia hypogeia TaxID=1777140 RepID=A0A157ZKC1_9BURK|nr:MFS transporter [Caballeronia hypogeia]SAK45984.1 membrane protein [Caballeronia hypogeia]
MHGIEPIEKRVIRKVTWRIVPFIIACYFFAYLDRVNVGIAALQMNDDIGLSAAAFGFGSGIFFLGYFLFEVPSNLLLQRFGARRWIARIMITWGLIAAAMVFVQGTKSFVALRFLLGAAEAGFYPGVILYITYFFPAAYRGRIVAIFTTGVPLSLFLGSPVSTMLLEMHGMLGLAGWKWLFLLEAIPSVLLGIACLWVLSDRPADAAWLDDDERRWLERRLADDRAAQPERASRSLLTLLIDPKVLGCAFVYAGIAAASVGLAVWQPQIIKSHGLTNLEAGLLNSVPYGAAVIAMLVWGRMSDLSRNRLFYTLVPLVLVSIALASVGAIDALSVIILALSVAVMSTYAFKGPFWAFVSENFAPGEAAVVLAHVNAIGGLGSFLGSWSFGLVKGATGSYALGLLPIVALTTLGALIVACLASRPRISQAV